MRQDRWHQEVIVTLRPENWLFSELATILDRLDYSKDETGEVFFYARQDPVEPWQTDELVTVSVFIDGKEVDYYDDEVQNIDEIQLGYLLPWQPVENAGAFVKKVWELAGELATPVRLDEKQIEKSELLALIERFANDLEERLEAPGGELLAQAIEEDLPI